jgi:hypothetical protein
MTAPTYRLCRKCGETWNVSCVHPGDKIYICPVCTWKKRKETQK